jgi:hypothetical protein
MKVYVLTSFFDYEDESNVGVYSTKEKAKQEGLKQMWDDELTMQSWEPHKLDDNAEQIGEGWGYIVREEEVQ